MKKIILLTLLIIPFLGFSQYLPKGYELDTTFNLQKGYVRELLMPYSNNLVHFISVDGKRGEIITLDLNTNQIINRFSNLNNCVYFQGVDTSGRYLFYYDLKTPFLIKKTYKIDLSTGKVKKAKITEGELDKYAFRGIIGMLGNIYSRDQLTLIRIPPIPSSKIELYRYIKN